MTRTLLIRMFAAFALAILAAGFISLRPVSAATLKHSVVVTADVVTLGDLFDGAGALAGVAVFRAPELGVNGALPVGSALAVAKTSGLLVDTAPDFTSVSVIRKSVELTPEMLNKLIAASASARLGVSPDDVAVTFEANPPSVMADANATQPAVVDSLNLQTDSGRFQAMVSVDVGSTRRVLDIRGRAAETIAVPVLTRPVSRLDIISDGDVTMSRLERRFVPANATLELNEVVGMAARRSLRAGDPIASSDVEAPKLVSRGEAVTIVLNRPGLALSARGRALSDGAKGNAISVLNEQSRRTIQGVVTGPGLVEVNTQTATIVATIKN